MTAASRIPPSALVQLVVAVLLLGAGWPVTKIALQAGAAPSWFALGRAGFSTVVAFAAVAAVQGVHLPGRADWPAVLSIGLLQLAGFFALAHAAVAWVPAGQTAILSNATIIWTVPISLLVLHERISPRRWLATALGAAGVIVLLGPWAIDWTSVRTLTGNAFLLGASLCWAVSMTVVHRFPPRQPLFALLPWTFLVATAALAPLALAHPPGTWPAPALIAMAVIGFVMAPVGTWCVIQAQAVLPLVVASVGFLAGPVVGLILSSVWLGEPFTRSLLFGALFILGGALVAAITVGQKQ